MSNRRVAARRWAFVAVATAAAIGVTGCSSDAPTSPSSTVAEPTVSTTGDGAAPATTATPESTPRIGAINGPAVVETTSP